MEAVTLIRFWVYLSSALVLSSCFSTRKTTDVVALPAATPQSQSPAAPLQLAPQVELPPDTCVKFTQLGGTPPLYLAELGFVLTAVHKPCITYEGEAGFYQDSQWTAMGIPCRGGGGRIEWRGKVLYPKMVSFVLSVDCPLHPTLDDAAAFGVQKLGFNDNSKLLAYNPFNLQFWSVPDFPDAGMGESIDLRSRTALDALWQKVRRREPINVHLYGRENAWIAGNSVYFIDTNIVAVSDTEFRLELLEVRTLSVDEIAAARRRCDQLRPRRRCHLVF